MDDLNARIAQQNAQLQREREQRSVSPAHGGQGLGYGAPPRAQPAPSALQRACSSVGRAPAPHHAPQGQHGGYTPQYGHAAPPHHGGQYGGAPHPPAQQYPGGGSPPPRYGTGYAGSGEEHLREEELDAEEAELDRMLDEERRRVSLSSGRGDGRGRGGGRGKGGGVGKGAGVGAGGGRGGAPAGRGSMRAKIPMIDSPGGYSPTGGYVPAGGPETAGAFEAGGGYAPSLAGRRGSSGRGGSGRGVSGGQGRPRDVHFTNDMYKEGSLFRGQAAEVLNPEAHNIRERMRRAGVAPRDHLKEERERLKHISLARADAEVEAGAAEAERRRRDEALRDRSLSRAQAALAEMGVGDTGGEGRRTTRRPAAEMAREAEASRAAAAVPSRHRSGVVPAYLQRRKAEWEGEAHEEAARAARAAECPPGLRLVGEEEKAAILVKLDEERKKTEAELRAMPFVIKTQRAAQLKDKLEARVAEIEGAVLAYSKPKVLVPEDA